MNTWKIFIYETKRIFKDMIKNIVWIYKLTEETPPCPHLK